MQDDPRETIRRLAALAWATDLPSNETFVAPIRYDFGPDPYARYRETDTP